MLIFVLNVTAFCQLSVALKDADDLRSQVEKLTARITELEGQVRKAIA